MHGKIDRPVHLCWVQRNHVAGDQIFESFLLLSTDRNCIKASHRQSEISDGPEAQSSNANHFGTACISAQALTNLWRAFGSTKAERLTVVAIIIGLLGYIAQFEGLRLSNFFCTIAQLLAMTIATVMRAVIRRQIIRAPSCAKVPEGHELDRLALSIVGGGPDDSKFPDERALQLPCLRFAFAPGEVLPLLDVDAESDDSASDVRANAEPIPKPISTAQHVLDMRKRLGAITKWKGPQSEDALILAKAIEATLRVLNPKLSKHKHRFGFKVKTNETDSDIYFSLSQKRLPSGDMEWKVDSTELEAALSLAAYDLHRQNEIWKQRQEISPNAGSAEKADTFLDWLRDPDLSPTTYDHILCAADGHLDALKADLIWWINGPHDRYREVKSASGKLRL
jgi:hypothetical protein